MAEMIIETQTMQRPNAVLKEYYARYLIEVRGLSQSSVRHYFDALNNISRRLKAKNLVKEDIYEVQDLEQLGYIREILYADVEFIELNKRGKRMYSAGLNNYYRFASGEGFNEAKDKILLLDMPVEPGDAIVIEHKTWKRSNIIRTQAIEYAGYTCEIDGAHRSFIAEKNKMPYMESHHAIPMKMQPNFDISLDVYANVVCLCPICHKRIHYGVKEDKKLMLNAIYSKRADRLANSGIKLSRTQFTELVVNM